MSESCQIRIATSADVQGIAKVHVDSWRETYTGIVSQDYLDSLSYDKRAEAWERGFAGDRSSKKDLVVEIHQRIVGFASVGKSRDPDFPYDGELYAIYLMRECQGKGVGKLLFEECKRALRDLGFAKMFVWVLRDNPTIKFYRHFGGKEFTSKLIKIGNEDLDEVALGWNNID